MGEVKITFETLYDLARREKGSEDLQKLDTLFYTDALTYVREKRALTNQTGPFSQTAQAQGQLYNTLKVLREIFEKREKKIIRLAMERVRTGSTIIDTTSLLPEEKAYYEDAVRFLQEHREVILHPLLEADGGNMVQSQTTRPMETAYKERQRSADKYEKAEDAKADVVSAEQESARNEAPDGLKGANMRVRFKTDVPKFLGMDKSIFGPFSTGDEADVPDYIARILLNKGKAEHA